MNRQSKLPMVSTLGRLTQHLFVFILLFTGLCSYSQSLVLSNANLIDVTNGNIQTGVDIYIEDGRIKSIDKVKKDYPTTITVVNCTGKFVIPGLWDMHTHTWNSKNFFPLLIAKGVTGIRDMFSNMDSVQYWRKQIAVGKITGPVIYASGPIVDGPMPIWPGSVALSDPAKVDRVLDSMIVRLRVDFIKVYSLLPKETYLKIAEVCDKRGIAFDGHVPNELSVLEAARAGQRSQEHLLSFIAESSDSAAYVTKVNRKEIVDPNLTDRTSIMRLQLNTFNERKLDDLIENLAKHNTWICPTLTVNRSMGNLKEPAFTNDIRTHYMMPGIASRWNPANDFRFKTMGDEYFELLRKGFSIHLKTVKKLHASGIKLLAGTDYPNPYCFPGFSLHDELELMVKAGLTPLAALQTATLNPALFFRITKDYGTVAQGKVANLLLLAKNPLEDIGNTKAIEAVLINGKFIAKNELETMLKKLWNE